MGHRYRAVTPCSAPILGSLTACRDNSCWTRPACHEAHELQSYRSSPGRPLVSCEDDFCSSNGQRSIDTTEFREVYYRHSRPTRQSRTPA